MFPPEDPVELSPPALAGELPALDPVEARVDGDLVRDHHRVEARAVRRVPERVELHAAHVAREAAFGVRDLHDGACGVVRRHAARGLVWEQVRYEGNSRGRLGCVICSAPVARRGDFVRRCLTALRRKMLVVMPNWEAAAPAAI